MRRQTISKRALAGFGATAPLGLGPAHAGLGLVLLGTTLLTALPAQAAPPYTQGDYLFILTREMPGPGGAFSLMDMHAPWPHDDSYGAIHDDAVARFHEGLIYVVNRGSAANIQVIDPAQDFQTIRQFSVEPNSNPQDICFAGPHRAFVTRYERTALWEVDPATGEHTGTIDLAPLADGDGLPEMQSLALHGDTLYVTLQRLDRDYGWIPARPAWLAMVDITANALIDADPGTPGMQGIALAGANPYHMNSCLGILPDPVTGDFLVSQLGDYGVFDGGIERFDPDTRESRGWIVTEAELGGDLNAWTTADGRLGFAVCSGPPPAYLTSVVAFDLQAGTNLGTVVSSSEYAYGDLLVDPQTHQLFVADRSYANPGVRVYDTRTFAPLTPGPVPVGLYPLILLACHGPQSNVSDGWTEPLALRLSPRPAAGSLTVRFDLAREQTVSIDVLDPCGRSVARLAAGARAPGRHEIRWDGRDPRGRPLSSGTYFVVLQAGGRREVEPVHWLR